MIVQPASGWPLVAQSVDSLRRSDTSGVGGEGTRSGILTAGVALASSIALSLAAAGISSV